MSTAESSLAQPSRTRRRWPTIAATWAVAVVAAVSLSPLASRYERHLVADAVADAGCSGAPVIPSPMRAIDEVGASVDRYVVNACERAFIVTVSPLHVGGAGRLHVVHFPSVLDINEINYTTSDKALGVIEIQP